MIDSKHFGKVAAIIIILASVICIFAVFYSDALADKFGDSSVEMEYEDKLFDTSSVIDINIIMDDDEWNEMLENAIDEEYYECDVEINDAMFSSVGIRPKGNTSLSSIASDPTTDRYSFKLEFDHYVDGQTCFGLDKLVLNNNYADATNMKEALVYDMYKYLDADASLYNYADISVNGETWGVYLALEAVEDSFLLRNYGTTAGELYKPDSMDFGGGGEGASGFDGGEGTPGTGGGEGKQDEKFTPPDEEQIQPENSDTQGRPPGNDGQGRPDGGNFTPPDTDGEFTPPDMGDDAKNGGGPGGFKMFGGGADLNYIDDDLDSYDTIWDGEVTKTNENDHERVVKALKNISEKNNIETYMQVENLLKYMAVHTFAVNLDSLSGNMAHNYYLYESDGKLNLIPWDYNLCWGGMQSGNDSSANDTVNFPIDTPFSEGISLEDRQFFAALLENDEYLAKYHEYLQKLCDEYIDGGRLENVYDRIRRQIDQFVENDPTAFYTYEEYDTAATTLIKVLELRAKSIEGQLSGDIPSTNEGQKAEQATLIDASDIDLSVMGVMNEGGGGPNKQGAPEGFKPQDDMGR